MPGVRGLEVAVIVNGFAGPGGWCVAIERLGLGPSVGIELDPAACATRAAAGLRTVRADVSAFDAGTLAGKVTGAVFSAPCTTFSAAGKRAAAALMDILDAMIRDQFDGSSTRAAHRREMARMLTAAWWPGPKLTREQRSAKIWQAVRSASLVAEPARFIAACRPEWVALEQVPAVLPLWQVYADELRRLGYSVWCGTLNAADYGVPQTRIRAILIASRARKVGRPAPTHYDPRKGMQLFGTPWVSMAEALGYGATHRPVPAVTAGGTATGGAEPLARGGREALEAARDAGKRVVRPGAGGFAEGYERSAGEPSPTVRLQTHSWHLRRDRGAGMIEREGERRDHPPDEPAPCITAGVKGSGPRMSWVRTGQQTENGNGDLSAYERPTDTAAPTVTTKADRWTLRIDAQANATCRPVDSPADTIKSGHSSAEMQWVRERPATTVMADPRLGRPGHKGRESGGESHFAIDSVRITPEEAAALQSFPPGYPWQGGKTKVFEQIGNAVPPLLGEHVLAEASGTRLPAAGELA